MMNDECVLKIQSTHDDSMTAQQPASSIHHLLSILIYAASFYPILWESNSSESGQRQRAVVDVIDLVRYQHD